MVLVDPTDKQQIDDLMGELATVPPSRRPAVTTSHDPADPRTRHCGSPLTSPTLP